MSAHLGVYQGVVDAAWREITTQRIVERICARDHTVWKPEPTEITNRLGWLYSPEAMMGNLESLRSFVHSVQAAGYSQALLLGMGGSSLAPEVFRKTFGVKEGYLDLAVLDSTTPGAVLAQLGRLDLKRTLFIVSTKSGGTVETLSFFKFFYNQVVEAVGAGQAGAHFAAITDPGSGLAALARQYRFRATFLNDPNIGGRYSALSHFGLLPAALMGVELEALLERALATASSCRSGEGVTAGSNIGARLGGIMGSLASAGRDKVTLILSPAIASLSDWLEQLIAESTGKEGKGILPVVGEPVGAPAVYGDDRLFAYLTVQGDHAHDAEVGRLEEAGQPVVRLHLRDPHDLGGQFYLWEVATAVASHFLGVNPFDQPNVEAAKVLARRLVDEYIAQGTLPGDSPRAPDGKMLAQFLAQARPGDYVALQAYLAPTSDTDAALLALRLRLRDQYRLATTAGYGPRFLHSTGQLHKGDAGNGLFVQFTSDPARDVPIPDEAGGSTSSITFGTLATAQAMGDRQALLDAGRRVIRFHLGANASGELGSLAEAVG